MFENAISRLFVVIPFFIILFISLNRLADWLENKLDKIDKVDGDNNNE